MIEAQANRIVYGKVLAELGDSHPEIVVLDADISKSTNTFHFAKKFPERFFNIGIAEQNLVGIAAGLATTGLIPFVSTFAVFLSMRACEQIRTGIAYPKLNVKIVATNAGVEIAGDGATHQAIEDISIMRTIPNMVVLSPSDPVTTRLAVNAMLDYKGPVYMRLGRQVNPILHEGSVTFTIGKMIRIREGNDVAIIATGNLLAEALAAAEELGKMNIKARVLDCHTIKPIDEEEILNAARETRGIITVEDHSVIGGLGSAVSEVTSRSYPSYVLNVGMKDCFGSSGRDYKKLLSHYHLDKEHIIKNAMEIMAKPSR